VEVQSANLKLSDSNSGASTGGANRIGAGTDASSVRADFVFSSTADAQAQWNLFEVTLASIGDAVISTDASGRVKFLNLAAEKMTGWPSNEAVGLPLESIFKIVHEKTRETVSNPISQALSQGEVVALANHTVLIARDGTETDIEDSAAPIRDSTGRIIGAVMVFHDVTERRKVSRALKERARLADLRADIGSALVSGNSLQSVLQQCAEALVCHLDAAFARIWTLNEEEQVLELQASAGLYTHLDGPHGRVRVGEFKIGRIAQKALPILTNDVLHDSNIGDPEWAKKEGMVAFAGHPMMLEDRVLGVMAMFARHPFSETVLSELASTAAGIAQWVRRKQSEDALRSSELFNRAVFESIPDCAKILDSEGRLQSMNGNGLCLMEIDDFGPFVNQHWPDLWPEASAENVRRAVGKAAAGETARFEAFCPTAKGTPKWWDVTVAPIETAEQGNAPRRLISVSRDITERKRSEEMLKIAKEEAETASSAKDTFLAILSHELRTPLTPVLMTASSLREDETLDPQLRAQMAMIERNIYLEVLLIDDLLDLTRISRGKLCLRTEPCELNSLVELVVEMIREESREKKIDIGIKLGAKRTSLIGDPARLQQVFWNLLRNAVKFTPPGGRIQIRSLDCENDALNNMPTRVCIAVSDNGIGLDGNAIERIFQPFEQVPSSQKHRTAGLGLGLAIARGIVDMHHGEIRVESAGHGHGSTFSVELPATIPVKKGSLETSQARLKESDGTPDAEPSFRLLLVEDHEATSQVLKRLLTRAGHHVLCATDIAEARAIAARQEFDLVISDLGLPDGTGIELMEELNLAYGLRGIVLSGYGMEEDIRRSLKSGFAAHLVKPVDFKELCRSIRRFAVAKAEPKA
jgi:PAS domain S-box-containing protein